MTDQPILSPAERMGLTGSRQANDLGIPTSAFNRWAAQGLIYDDDQTRPGYGSPRRAMTDREAKHLTTMKSLVDEGIAAATASRLARELLDTGTAQLGAVTLTAA